MKKIMSLILALVMVFSLCACGGTATEETSGTNKETTNETTEQSNKADDTKVDDIPKEIIITVDNWQDYFEIKEVPTWDYNDFDEIEEIGYYVTAIVLKDEYANMEVSDETKLAFEYTAVCKEVSFEGDIETLVITLGEPDAESETVTETLSFDKVIQHKERMTATYKQLIEVCQPIALFPTSPYVGKAIIYEDISISRVEGTLIFK